MTDLSVKVALQALEARVLKIAESLDKGMEILSEIHGENEKRHAAFLEHKESIGKRFSELEERVNSAISYARNRRAALAGSLGRLWDKAHKVTADQKRLEARTAVVDQESYRLSGAIGEINKLRDVQKETNGRLNSLEASRAAKSPDKSPDKSPAKSLAAQTVNSEGLKTRTVHVIHLASDGRFLACNGTGILASQRSLGDSQVLWFSHSNVARAWFAAWRFRHDGLRCWALTSQPLAKQPGSCVYVIAVNPSKQGLSGHLYEAQENGVRFTLARGVPADRIEFSHEQIARDWLSLQPRLVDEGFRVEKVENKI